MRPASLHIRSKACCISRYKGFLACRGQGLTANLHGQFQALGGIIILSCQHRQTEPKMLGQPHPKRVGIADQLASRFGYAARPIPDAVDAAADTLAGFQNHDLEVMGERESGHQAKPAPTTAKVGRDRRGHALLAISQSSMGNRCWSLLRRRLAWSFRSLPEILEPYRRCNLA
jgi:hypothetical protein